MRDADIELPENGAQKKLAAGIPFLMCDRKLHGGLL
jgi:hypothetical protein